MEDDSPYRLSCLLVRHLPAKDTQRTSFIMSVIRVLCRNPQLVLDSKIPKVTPIAPRSQSANRTSNAPAFAQLRLCGRRLTRSAC